MISGEIDGSLNHGPGLLEAVGSNGPGSFVTFNSLFLLPLFDFF